MAGRLNARKGKMNGIRFKGIARRGRWEGYGKRGVDLCREEDLATRRPTTLQTEEKYQGWIEVYPGASWCILFCHYLSTLLNLEMD